MNGDLLRNLPTSTTSTYTPQDATLVNHLFDSVAPESSEVVKYIKNPLLVAAIVGIMLLPIGDSLILKIYPQAAENTWVTIIIKMIVAAILYYLISNWGLARA